MKTDSLNSAVESILLASGRPVSLQELAAATGTMVPAIKTALTGLAQHYTDRGIRLIQKGDSVQFVTAPDQTETLRRFHKRELRAELTLAALETLAIVAYREPLTRSVIEEIRGVSSETILRALLIRGLIREVGRSEAVGRPILYATTLEFLQHFGLSSSSELPPLPEALDLPPPAEHPRPALFTEPQ